MKHGDIHVVHYFQRVRDYRIRHYKYAYRFRQDPVPSISNKKFFSTRLSDRDTNYTFPAEKAFVSAKIIQHETRSEYGITFSLSNKPSFDGKFGSGNSWKCNRKSAQWQKSPKHRIFSRSELRYWKTINIPDVERDIYEALDSEFGYKNSHL